MLQPKENFMTRSIYDAYYITNSLQRVSNFAGISNACHASHDPFNNPLLEPVQFLHKLPPTPVRAYDRKVRQNVARRVPPTR